MDPVCRIRDVVDACADCDICRDLMKSSCLFFSELYKLIDEEMDSGKKIASNDLRNLVELCNFCALCPCYNIRSEIVMAKTEFIDRDGLKFNIRVLEDVEPMGKLCGAIPHLVNFLLQGKVAGSVIKAVAGIHTDRKMPEVPGESFPAWADKHMLSTKTRKPQKRKVAYFAGCSGRHFFSDVPKAVVNVFQHNGIECYYPEQQCCGMPPMLEGDRKLTLKFSESTVERLAEAIDDGYDIVCSCPTCGFMLKNVLKEGAYYSPEYQASVGGDDACIKIPAEPDSTAPEEKKFSVLKKSIYGNLFKDDGLFSSISPLKRIKVAENTFDLGEYLRDLHRTGELETTFGPVPARTAYYPPCHLREQNIGRPYLDLLGLIPGISIDSIENPFYCCGIAGIMGFKREFHAPSIKIGNRLISKIKELNPEKLITDCLGCRLQFYQLTSYKVLHPVEIMEESYAAYGSQDKKTSAQGQ